MKKNSLLFYLVIFVTSTSFSQQAIDLDREEVLEQMQLANTYFMEKWPDAGDTITLPHRDYPSHIWTRAVYYEGLMALHEIYPKEEFYNYALDWAKSHNWGFHGKNTNRNADNYCAAQTYIDLYNLEPKPEKLKNTRAAMQKFLHTPQNGDWDWIDAIQMGMPVFAKLGVLENDERYFEKMYEMYMASRNSIGENGLFNPEDGLWWRDADFDPPYSEPNGEDAYWSRGNGWVIVALAKVLDIIPEEASHRDQYIEDLQTMAEVLAEIQREDGFWNVSLHDPNHYGGKELTGTASFIYGMAYGVNNGLLDKDKYIPIIEKAWKAMIDDSLHENGFLGYVQSTGKEPKAGQPLSYEKVPDFEDYGLGLFLLAGAEIYKME